MYFENERSSLNYKINNSRNENYHNTNSQEQTKCQEQIKNDMNKFYENRSPSPKQKETFKRD